MPRYNDRLSPDEQISAEEAVAAHLFEEFPDGFEEETAADAARAVVQMILARFRPDLFETEG